MSAPGSSWSGGPEETGGGRHRRAAAAAVAPPAAEPVAPPAAEPRAGRSRRRAGRGTVPAADGRWDTESTAEWLARGDAPADEPAVATEVPRARRRTVEEPEPRPRSGRRRAAEDGAPPAWPGLDGADARVGRPVPPGQAPDWSRDAGAGGADAPRQQRRPDPAERPRDRRRDTGAVGHWATATPADTTYGSREDRRPPGDPDRPMPAASAPLGDVTARAAPDPRNNTGRRAVAEPREDWRTSTGPQDSGAAGARDWRTETGATGEWPTSEWTRVGRAAAEWRTAAPSPTASPAAPAPIASPTPAGAMPRLLATVRLDGRPVLLEEHLAAYGPLRLADPAPLLRLVAESGLRGRGGAGFPVDAKMRAVLAARGRAVVVVNGAASDPTSEKDTFLLTRLPHLILDGAQVAAAAVRARQVLVYVVARPLVYGAVERAVAERKRARVDAVPVRLVPGPERYVAGESSAVVNALSGGRALPTFQPPHTAERGVRGRPTLVQNVETLANLALLARYGARWFRGVGVPDEPGSLVLTVTGAVPRRVVIEVPVGTPVEHALVGAGWLTEPVGAVLVGGCFGRWLPAALALPAPLSHAGMAAAGGTLGANVLVALPERACGLDETARLARYLAGETAGQCGACVNGLPAIAETMTALAEGRADPATVHRLYRWCGMVSGRGACHHPDGTAGLVASALDVFADEVGRHLDGRCGRPLRGVIPLPAAAPPPPGRPGRGHAAPTPTRTTAPGSGSRWRRRSSR